MAVPRQMPLASLLALMALLAGCRSNPQAELVERELRWQENQIYALEDYLMEYQAKVRRLREENASLAQALEECEAARGSSRDSTRQRSKAQKQPEELPPLNIELPAKNGGQPTAPSGVDEPPASATDRETPLLEPRDEDGAPLDIPPVPLPEVPKEEPLLPSTWLGPPPLRVVTVDLPWIVPQEEPIAEQATESLEASAITLSSTSPDAVVAQVEPALAWISGGLPEEPADPAVVLAIEPLPDPVASDEGAGGDEYEVEPVAETPLENDLTGDVVQLHDPTAQPPGHVAWVLLQAELARDPDSAGQLLQLRVTPMAADDLPTRFAGGVSVMLRDPAVSGPEGRMARWDFTEDEVSAAWAETSGAEALGFALPLAEPLPSERPIALWVRLNPADEALGKVLDHLTLRLEGSRRRSTPVDLEGGKWAVARPGEPALVDGPRPRVTSAWRTADATATPVRR